MPALRAGVRAKLQVRAQAAQHELGTTFVALRPWGRLCMNVLHADTRRGPNFRCEAVLDEQERAICTFFALRDVII